MSFQVKICGLKSENNIIAAEKAGATMIGFVFFEKSPRNIPQTAAAQLAHKIKQAALVGLFVDPNDAFLKQTLFEVPLDYLQLHGTETPERIAEIKALTGIPIIKALGIETAADIADTARFDGLADYLILDAKPPKEAAHPGGLGQTFDWKLLNTISCQTPWMVSGGLTPDNVYDAVQSCMGLPGFTGVDVSSGVEISKGQKDAALIQRFVTTAHAAMSAENLKDA